MAKVDADLRRLFRDNPDKSWRLIVRTKSDIGEYEAELKQLGFRVARRFKLIPGAAISGKGRDALTLLDKSWVQSVEEDKPIHTMSR